MVVCAAARAGERPVAMDQQVQAVDANVRGFVLAAVLWVIGGVLVLVLA